jgi:hypothetical protein
MGLKSIHITYLKKYIDQLIISKGVLQVENPEIIVDKVKIDYLSKLAFRFYSVLYSSEKYSDFIKASEKTVSEDNSGEHAPMFHVLHEIISNISESENKNIQCLNCGVDIPIAVFLKNKDGLPICDECLKSIGREFSVWENIFD